LLPTTLEVGHIISGSKRMNLIINVTYLVGKIGVEAHSWTEDSCQQSIQTLRRFLDNLRKGNGQIGQQSKEQRGDAGYGSRSCNQISSDLCSDLDDGRIGDKCGYRFESYLLCSPHNQGGYRTEICLLACSRKFRRFEKG
jgi:hypothetical protein